MYFKILDGDFLLMAGVGQRDDAIEISKSEYDAIINAFYQPHEAAPQGKMWRLRNDTLEYELCEIQPLEPEATSEDYEESLESLGVNTDEEENA